MQQEIEVKFLDAPHDEMRERLTSVGAVCEHPMRLMRRAIIDYPDRRMQTASPDGWGWVRVRDEVDKVTCTYKHIAADGKDTTYEIEFAVSSYEKTVQLFEAIGLMKHAEQETKRETWKLDDVEVVLDEWPWIPPYIEIEGSSEHALQTAAAKLGIDWSKALHGSSDRAYRIYYPRMTEEESITDAGVLTFDGGLPQWLKERQ